MVAIAYPLLSRNLCR